MIMFNNSSISQTNVRPSNMNNTMGTFAVNLANNTGAARNSIVGGRHIPITKFARGSTRGRGTGPPGKEGENGKRISSINFYTNSSKLKNALDLSVTNTYETAKNSSIPLNESVISSQGIAKVSGAAQLAKPNTALGSYDGVYNN